MMAITWIQQFVQLAGKEMLPYTSGTYASTNQQPFIYYSLTNNNDFFRKLTNQNPEFLLQEF